MGKFQKFLARKRVSLSFFFGGFFIVFIIFFARVRQPSMLFFTIGLEIVILGEAIRTWASGYLKKGEVMAVNGPYAYARYPLYGGSFLIGTGFCIAAYGFCMAPDILVVFMVFLLLFGIAYRTKIISEEKEMEQKFGVEFVGYQQSVSRFFPSFNPYKTNVISTFSWQQVLSNKEYRAWIGILTIGVIMIVKLYMVNKLYRLYQ